MKRIFHKLFFSCQKVTELIEKKKCFKLSLSENVRLAIHKMACSACSKFEKQSLFIEECIINSCKKSDPETDIEELKRRIIIQIDDNNKK